MAPNDAEAYNIYSNICMLENDYKMAETYLKKSIFLDENFFKNYYDISLVYLAMDNKEKAIEMVKKSISLNDNFPPAKELLQKLES